MEIGARQPTVREPAEHGEHHVGAVRAGAAGRPGRTRVTDAARLLGQLIVALRPRQWIKNGLVFVPLAFTANLLNLTLLAQTASAFVLFCALSGAGYLLNDLMDAEADRQHPVKRSRPIASGALPAPLAIGVAVLLAVVAIGGSLAIRPALGLVAAAYLVLTLAYTLWLKHLVLVDIFSIAAGFALRAAAGAVAIAVPISPWLYITTMLGALVIALGKRRAELRVLGDRATDHRQNLSGYSPGLVDQLLLIVSSAVVMTYALYTFEADHLPSNHSMMLTIPLVLYGLFRYLFLTQSTEAGGAPEELLLRDRPLLACIAAWGLLAATIVHLGPGR